MRVLVTSGPTQEPIDRVRFISNVSSGRTGATIARLLVNQGHEVLLLRGQDSQTSPVPSQVFRTTADLEGLMKRSVPEVDWVIHAAAVSDYRMSDVVAKKIDSSHSELTLQLVPTPKLVESIKSWNSGVGLVAFKLTATENLDEQAAAVRSLRTRSGADWVIHNDLTQFEGEEQHWFQVWKDDQVLAREPSAESLAEWLVNRLEFS